MLKIKAGAEQKTTKEGGGAPHALTPYSSTSNWFPIQSGSPPTLEICSEMEAELGLAEVRGCMPSQVTQLGSLNTPGTEMGDCINTKGCC